MEEWVSRVPSFEESACVLYLSADSEMTSFPRLCLETRHTHLPADVLLGCHYFSAPSSHPRPAFGTFGDPLRATSDFYAFLQIPYFLGWHGIRSEGFSGASFH